MNAPDWRARAACRNSDPELFFPIRDDGYKGAAELCAGCPVLADCLAEALDLKCVHGYRGGTTGEDRAQLLRERNRNQPKLTPEEKILALSAAGKQPREIAARLRWHVDRVRRVLRKAREAA